MEQFAIVLSYLSILSVLIPIGIYLVYPSAYTVAKTLFVLLLVSLSADIANEFYVRSGHQGYVIINAFFSIQFVLLSFIYYRLLQLKQFITVSTIVYLFLVLADSFYFQAILEFQNIMRIVESVLLIFYALYSYSVILKRAETNKSQHYLLLWFNLAIVFYCFSNLYLFGISDYILKEMFREDAIIIWGFHSVNNIVKNLFLGIALFGTGTQPTFSIKKKN